MKQNFLVLLEALPPTALLRRAAVIAQALNSSLDALLVCEPMAPVLSQLLEERPDMDSARAAGQRFREWSKGTQLSSARWLVAEGHVLDVLKLAADWHDLLIVQRDDQSAWGSTDAIGRLIVELHLPVLVLPKDYRSSARFDTVVVAWNGTPEATRALHCARPLLRKAKRCLLLRGKPSRQSAHAERHALFDLDDYLKRNEIVAEPLAMPGSTDPAPAQLFDSLIESQADLLVMGGYGHSRFNQWLFGGLTRSALESCPLPVLFRH